MLSAHVYVLLLSLQALTSTLGWTYLDVRSSLECEDVGKVKGSVNVPMVNATKKWDSEQQKKVVKKEDNPNFVQQVIMLCGHHCIIARYVGTSLLEFTAHPAVLFC